VKQALFQLSYDPELHKRISLPACTGKAVLLAEHLFHTLMNPS